MSKSKRTTFVLSMIAVVLVCAITVVGTLAYLNDKTGELKNTFTIGKVDITLEESVLKDDGTLTNNHEIDSDKGYTPEGGTKVFGNKYKIVPDNTYPKDPQVSVQPGSEASWVFVKVEVSEKAAAVIDVAALKTQITTTYGWTELEAGVYYKQAAAVAEDAAALPLQVFASFTVKADASNAQLAALVAEGADEFIKISAYAVQKANSLDTAAKAWAAANPTSGN